MKKNWSEKMQEGFKKLKTMDPYLKQIIEMYGYPKDRAVSNSFKTYTVNDENDCLADISYNNVIPLDLSGATLYKWRITAQNYLIKDTDLETQDHVACTPWSNTDQYYIDMVYPEISYNFILKHPCHVQDCI